MLISQSKDSTAKKEASIYTPPYLAIIAILTKSDLVCGNVFILAFSM
jgi:hypothetical protein